MNARTLGHRYESFLTLILVLLFFSGFAQYLHVSGVIPGANFAALALSLALMAPVWANLSHKPIPIHPLVIWSYVYVLFSSIWMVGGEVSLSTVDGLAYALMYLILLTMGLTLLRRSDNRDLATRAILWVTVLSTLINLYEYLNPGVFSVVTGRSAGLYQNPNTSAATLVMGMILSYRVVPASLRLVFPAFVGIGVVATFSRSGLLCWLLSAALLHVFSNNIRSSLRSVFPLMALLTITLYPPIWTRIADSVFSQGIYNPRLFDRLQRFGGAAGHEDARVTLAREAWHMFQQRPLFGYGAGTPLIDLGSAQQGPHNMYLTMLVQFGVLGGVLFLALIGILLYETMSSRSVQGVIFALFIAVSAFFTHQMLSYPQYPIAIALTASSVALHHSSRPMRRTIPVRHGPPPQTRLLRDSVP